MTSAGSDLSPQVPPICSMESPLAVFLLAAGHQEREGVGHALRVFQVIERARLLEVNRSNIFQHSYASLTP